MVLMDYFGNLTSILGLLIMATRLTGFNVVIKNSPCNINSNCLFLHKQNFWVVDSSDRMYARRKWNPLKSRKKFLSSEESTSNLSYTNDLHFKNTSNEKVTSMLQSLNFCSSSNDSDVIKMLQTFHKQDIRGIDLITSGKFEQIEKRLMNISFSLQDTKIVSNKNDDVSVSLLHLLKALANIHIIWGGLSRALRSKLETSIHSYFDSVATQQPNVAAIIELLECLGALKANYRKISSKCRAPLKSAILLVLKHPPAGFSLPMILSSLSQIGIVQSDLSPTELHRFKSLLPRLLSKSRHTTNWKILHSIADMQFKWPSLDISIRQGLEQALQVYETVPSWLCVPREVSAILSSLARMQVRWSLLENASQRALSYALMNSISTMSPRDLCLSLQGLGAMGTSWSSLDGNIRAQLSDVFISMAGYMTPWDLVQCTVGLGRMGSGLSVLDEQVVRSICIQAKRFGPLLTAHAIFGLGTLLASDASEGFLESVNTKSNAGVNVNGNPSAPPSQLGLLVMLDALNPLLYKWSHRMSVSQIKDTVVGLLLTHQSMGFSSISKTSPSTLISLQNQVPMQSEIYHDRSSSSLWTSFVLKNTDVNAVAASYFEKKDDILSSKKSDEANMETENPVEESSLSSTSLDSGFFVGTLLELSSVAFASFLSFLGGHSITYALLSRDREVLEAVEEKLYTVLSRNIASTSNSFSEHRSLDLSESLDLAALLKSLVSMSASWDTLNSRLQSTIWSRVLELSSIYEKVRYSSTQLFLSPQDFDEERRLLNAAVDDGLWAIGCLRAPLTDLNEEQQRQVLNLSRMRLQDGGFPKTVSMVLLGLAGMQWNWVQSMADDASGTRVSFSDSLPSLLSDSVHETLSKDLSTDIVTEIICGLQATECKWEYMSTPLRESLIRAMYSMLSTGEHCDWLAVSHCIEGFGNLGGLSHLTPRQGDRLLIFLSRYADVLGVSTIMKVLPVIGLTRTTNRRTLSYLSRRLAGIVLSETISGSGSVGSSSSSQFRSSNAFSVSDLIVILRVLSDLHDSLPTSAWEGISRQYYDDKELRQQIISQSGAIFRAVKPVELVEVMTLLASLGIRWSEYAASRHSACMLTVRDVSPLLPRAERRRLREAMLNMGVSESKLKCLLSEDDPGSLGAVPVEGRSADNLRRFLASRVRGKVVSDALEGEGDKGKVSSVSNVSLPDAPENSVEVQNLQSSLSEQSKLTSMDSDSSDSLAWSSLEDLRLIFHTIKSANLANTLWFCASRGYSMVHLQAAGLWGLFDERLGQSISEWAHVHQKVSMLINALDKIEASPQSLSPFTRDQIIINLIAQFPSMTPRSVSNILYFMARLRWQPTVNESRTFSPHSVNFRNAATKAFMRTLGNMSRTTGEFSNAVWAAGHVLGVRWSSLSKQDQKTLSTAIESREATFSGRDFSTIAGALRAFRAGWKALPPSLKKVLEEKTASIASTMDSSSFALLLLSIGSIHAPWNELSPVTRVAIRDAVGKLTSSLSIKELSWLLTGLGDMHMSWNVLSVRQKTEITSNLIRNANAGAFELTQLKNILRAFVQMGTDWTILPDKMKVAIESEIVRLVQNSLLHNDLNSCYELFGRMAELGSSWTSVQLSPVLSGVLSTLLGRSDSLNTIKNKETLSIMLNCFESIKIPKENMPMTLPNNLVVAGLISAMTGPKRSVWALPRLRALGFDWTSLSSPTSPQLSAMILSLATSARSDRAIELYFLSVLEELVLFKCRWQDLTKELQAELLWWLCKDSHVGLVQEPHMTRKYVFPSVQLDVDAALKKAIDTLRSSQAVPSNVDSSVRHKKGGSSTQPSNSCALSVPVEVLSEPSNSARAKFERHSGKMDDVVKPIASNKKRLLEDLNHRLPELSDQDFLRLLFLLGQRRLQLPVSSAGEVAKTLSLLDERLAAVISDLSPGAIIAVLTSLSRLSLKAKHMPHTFPPLVMHVSASASSLDSRTLTAALKSLYGLGLSWANVTADQRMGLVAGVARSASAAPQRFGTLLGVLRDLQVPWSFLHEKIHVVLRFVVYKIFTELSTSLSSSGRGVVTCESTASSLVATSTPSGLNNDISANNRENGIEVLLLLVDMHASWEELGDKAGNAILKAMVSLLQTNDEVPCTASSCDDQSKITAALEHIYKIMPPDAQDRLDVVDRTRITSLLQRS